jgi:hypothetical protein
VTAPPRCSAGNDPSSCCAGDPWVSFTGHSSEPLAPDVIRVAAELGIDPHVLDLHVEEVHGWEPHDDGYAEAVGRAARCLAVGECGIRASQ